MYFCAFKIKIEGAMTLTSPIIIRPISIYRLSDNL